MFPMLSFQQANPVLSGVSAVQDIDSKGLQQQYMKLLNSRMGTENQYLPDNLQAKLRQMQIANGISQNQLNYAPQMSQADLAIKRAQPALINAQTGETNARIPLYNAQASLADQQAKYFPYTTAAKMDPVTAMIAGRYFLNNLGAGGGGSQGAPPIQSNDGGMTVQPTNPVPSYLLRQQGNPAQAAANMPVLPGGLSPAQGQQVAQQMNTPPQGASPQVGLPPAFRQQLGFGNGQGSPGGSSIYDQLYSLQLKNQIAKMGKDPMFGSSRSGMGGSYVDPFTGKTVSTDTSAQTTRDQRAIASIDNVNSYLGKAMTTLPQFQGAKARATVGAQGLSNYLFGTDYPGPSQLASGKAAVLSAAEGFINAFGLNATNENVNKAAEIMTPNFGESANGYKQRAASQLKDFAEQQQRAANRLRQGENVSPDAYASQGDEGAHPQGSPQIEATKTFRGKQYYLINGKWHE